MIQDAFIYRSNEHVPGYNAELILSVKGETNEKRKNVYSLGVY
jgi:hypothetical protein